VSELAGVLAEAAGHVKAEQAALYELKCAKALLDATLDATQGLVRSAG
jgi:hypothetical protein